MSQIEQFLCSAVHVIIYCSVFFWLLCFPNERWNTEKDKQRKEERNKRMRPKLRELRVHELPSTEMVKSGTIRLTLFYGTV